MYPDITDQENKPQKGVKGTAVYNSEGQSLFFPNSFSLNHALNGVLRFFKKNRICCSQTLCNPLGESWGERSIAWDWLKTIIM